MMKSKKDVALIDHKKQNAKYLTLIPMCCQCLNIKSPG